MSRRKTPRRIRGIENRLHADGTWTFRVRWRCPVSDRRLSEEFDEQLDAVDFKAELRRAKRSNRLGELSAGQQLLRDFVSETWWPTVAAVELESATLSAYASAWNRHLRPRIGHLQLRQISAPVIAKLRRDLEVDGVGAQMIVKALTMLQSALRTAVVWGLIPGNPVTLVRKPYIPRPAVHPPAPATIERIVQWLRDREDEHGPSLVYLVGYEGLRPSEALALQGRHVRVRTLLVEQKNVNGEILSYQKVKTKRPRPVDLLAAVAADLGRRRPEQFVIAHTDGTPWRTSDYDAWRTDRWQPACEAVGIGKITLTRNEQGRSQRTYRGATPYWLRHASCSMRLLEGRLSPAEIAEQHGHTLQTFLTTYAHIISELRGQGSVPMEEQIERARAELRRSS